MLISVIIPTYLRTRELDLKIKEAVEYSHLEDVEFVFVIEADDREALKKLNQTKKKNIKVIM